MSACQKHDTGGGPCYCSGSVCEPIAVFGAAARRFWIAEQADHCAKWLQAQGLEVLLVEKSPRTPPRITVRTSPLCDRFEGAVSGYSRVLNHARTVQTELRYKMVMRHGCEVRWEDACPEPVEAACPEQNRTLCNKREGAVQGLGCEVRWAVTESEVSE